MKILIIGSGGREHALAWKCAQTADEVIVAPGNAGTARENKVRNAPVSSDDIDALIALAQKERVNLTIVGPEAPLSPVWLNAMSRMTSMPASWMALTIPRNSRRGSPPAKRGIGVKNATEL